MCGYNCKKASIPTLLEKLKPDICTWQETGLTGNNQIKIKGYHASLRNRKDFIKMGGVCTAVQNALKPHTVKIVEGEDDEEFLVTRIDKIKPALNIINVYGKIEDRMEAEEVLESWGRIKTELDNIQARHESCILLGDFNRSIGAGEFGVQGNKPQISPGGKLIRELLKEGEYVLANNLEKATGGPWTWICRADGTVRSCLDLVIISADLEPYLSSLVVDTRFEYAPFRVRKIKKGETRKIFPDHYPIVVKFKNLPTDRIKSDCVSNWNLSVPERWKKYEALT